MYCIKCGIENSSDAHFCQKCGNPVSGTPNAVSQESRSPRNGPAIWNPNATVNWSLLFSPAFGSYIQMLNWNKLGEPDRAASSRNWFYVSLGLLGIYILIGITMADSKSADGAARGFCFLYLIFWYFTSGRSQSRYVKEKYGTTYPRKPWGKVLLAAVGFFVVYILVAVVVWGVAATAG